MMNFLKYLFLIFVLLFSVIYLNGCGGEGTIFSSDSSDKNNSDRPQFPSTNPVTISQVSSSKYAGFIMIVPNSTQGLNSSDFYELLDPAFKLNTDIVDLSISDG